MTTRRGLRNGNLAVLAAAQMVSVTGIVGVVTLGGILGQRLAPAPALATLPVSCQIVGMAAATIGAAWLMSRIGRGKGFAIGALLGCCGALVVVLALAAESFALLAAGAALNGVAAAFGQQYRFAAVESAPALPGPAVSLVLTGSLGGALAGPALAAWGEDWLPGLPFGGTFLAIALCYLAIAPWLARLRIDAPAQAGGREAPARPLAAIVRQRRFLAAVAGGVAGFGAMTFVMTAAPLSMHALDGHSLAASAAVIQGHVLAMYLPSLATGLLVMRFGAARMMAAGAATLAATLAFGFLGREVPHYMAAMIALGVGWNFLFIGATVLLGRTHTAAERFRVQAVNDFSVFGVSALGSLSAGAVLHFVGWHGVLTAAAAPIALAAAALALLRKER